MKRGKKYQDAVKAYDRSAQYDVAEAIDLVKKNATAKFDETIELHLRTGCDGRHAEQQIRGAVVLPHGTGKTVKVLVFAKGTKVDEAQAAGADFVGGEELIPKIQNEGWLDFDVVVATPDMMGVVGRLDVYSDLKDLCKPEGWYSNNGRYKKLSTISKLVRLSTDWTRQTLSMFRSEKHPFTEEQLADNFQTLIDAINKVRPAAVKGQYLKKCNSYIYNGTWRED